ncbi:MAG: 16S rRNA (uracil(1498)-N(3))-methyltransferase [Bacteroidales bacterium]
MGELFYSEHLNPEEPLLLSAEDSRHAVRVMRLKPGDRLEITDGKGMICTGIIEIDNPKSCQVRVTGTRIVEAPFYKNLHIAVAPTKNISRFEWFLEKATETGVGKITPLICKRSERKSVRTDRLLKILISAMKQSKQSWLPELTAPEEFKSFVTRKFDGQKFIPWISDESMPLLSKSLRQGFPAVIIIGPEGDFSDEEIIMARKSEFIPVSLGKNRLRTETAALVSGLTFNFVNQS